MLRYVERGYATVCCLNLFVRLSVRLSVTFRYRDHIGWNTLKIISQGPSEEKPLKNLGEKGAWAYPLSRDGPIFEYPLLSQERIKLRTSNLAGILTVSMRTKAG